MGEQQTPFKENQNEHYFRAARMVNLITKNELQDTVLKTRTAAEKWSQCSIEERAAVLKKLRIQIVERAEHLAEMIKELTGKPAVEALTNEIIPTLSLLAYNEKNCHVALATSKRTTPKSWIYSKSYVRYEPWGAVLILTPSNLPFQLSIVPAATALLSGNGLILKTSPIVQGMGPFLKDIFDRIGVPEDLINIVDGDHQTGQQIIDQKPDLIFVTGGVETGRKVMTQAAQHLIPVVLELGGKDPFIILDDAPYDRTLNAAVYAAFANAGQLCVSAERFYVHKNIAKKFTRDLVHKAKDLKLGSEIASDIGPLISDQQIRVINNQLDDAQQKGAKIVAQGENRGRLFSPTILSHVTHNMDIMNQETFGPIAPIMEFEDDHEVIELANSNPYGLNASIWSKNIKRAEHMAARLTVGNCGINEVIKNIGNPDLPFGGRGASGFGRYHGIEGLRNFTQSKSIMVNQGILSSEPNWFPYGPKKYKQLLVYIQLLFQDQSLIKKGSTIWKNYLKGNPKRNDEK